MRRPEGESPGLGPGGTLPYGLEPAGRDEDTDVTVPDGAARERAARQLDGGELADTIETAPDAAITNEFQRGQLAAVLSDGGRPAEGVAAGPPTGGPGPDEASPAFPATTGRFTDPMPEEPPAAAPAPALVASPAAQPRAEPGPAPRRGVGCGALVLACGLTSLVSALLGGALALAALSLPAVQRVVLGEARTAAPSTTAPAGIAAAPAGARPADPTASSPAPTADASPSPREAPIGSSPAPTAEPAPATGEASPTAPPAAPLSDVTVLPIAFDPGTARVVGTDDEALARIAKAIVSDRTSRYEVVGHVAPGEGEEPPRARQLAERRARRAFETLRGLGPSSGRFDVRAADPDEPMPEPGGPAPTAGRHGAVLRLLSR